MARARTKIYDKGEKINIFLSRNLTPEFLEWINKQSDLSSFFLYAAQQLYEKTGFVDVAEIMPRKINFQIDTHEENIKELPTTEIPSHVQSEAITSDFKEVTSKPKQIINDNAEKESWANIDELDDDYA